MENFDFLKKKYDLHNAPEVEASAERTEERTGEKVPNDPEAKIKNYLDRLEKLVLDPNKEQPKKTHGSETRPRALSLLREMVMNKYVRGNKEALAEGARRVEERAARDMGIEARYEEEQMDQRGDIAVTDLEKSLDNWISYLSDANEPYPVWFRYYAFRNVLDLGDYDKDKGEFTKRSEGSIKLFPDIDRGALAYIEQMIEADKDAEMLKNLQEAQQESANGDIPKNELLTKEKVANFAKISFAKQYSEAIRQSGEITPEMREITEGKWIKYGKGTDPTALWSSLQNKGVAWCTKGYGTAETHLKGGDFYVYYTLDKQNKPSIPRIAIRMQGDQIGETRGVADNQQNLEGNMTEIAEKKMSELPGKEKYQKISKDMKDMTAIYKKSFKEDKETKEKIYLKPELTKDELKFIYEIDSKIEGFGYQRDPRIEEIISQRNPKEDAPVVIECEPNQIAYSEKEINKNTKAYIGEFNPKVLKSLPKNIEHIYSKFPEQKVFLKEIIPDKEITSDKIAIKKLEEEGYKISDYSKDMLTKVDWKEKLNNSYEIVSISVGELFGDTEVHTYADIKEKAKENNFELVPAKLAPTIRLNYEKSGNWTNIAMEAIRDRFGYLKLFSCDRNDSASWLYSSRGNDGHMWNDNYRFFFARK